MHDGIQDGSQNIKMYIMNFYTRIPRVILHFCGNRSNNTFGIHLCIMTVQSNFSHYPFSAKEIRYFCLFIQVIAHIIHVKLRKNHKGV